MFLPPYFFFCTAASTGLKLSEGKEEISLSGCIFAELCSLLLTLERLGNTCFLFHVSDNFNMTEFGGSMLLT